MESTSGRGNCSINCRANSERVSRYCRWLSAKTVSIASEDFPDPLGPVITVTRSCGRFSEMFLRLCVRAPATAIPAKAAVGTSFFGAARFASLTRPADTIYSAGVSLIDRASITLACFSFSQPGLRASPRFASTCAYCTEPQGFSWLVTDPPTRVCHPLYATSSYPPRLQAT